MKRSLYFAAALAIVGAVSCNKELVDNSTPEVPEAKLATLTATIGEPGTKTSLATPEDAHLNGSKTFWCKEDAISVFDGASNAEYTIKDSDTYTPAEEAVFEGEELAEGATEFYALYPYTEAAEVAGGVIKGAVLPAEQTAVAGNLPEGAALAVAYSTDKSALYFKNVATTIGFTLTEAAEKVEFVAKGGESIAGTIDITYNGENDPTYTVQEEKGSNTVTLTNLAAGTYFFTILPDVTLTQGYELKIDGYTAKTGAVGTKLERSKIYSLETQIVPIDGADIWGVCGTFTNGWTIAENIQMTAFSDGWYRLEGVEIYKDDEFKFVTNNSWDTPLGAESVLIAEDETEYTLATPGTNIKVAKNGVFTIRLNPTENKFTVKCTEEYTDLTVQITIKNERSWSSVNAYFWVENGDADVDITTSPGPSLSKDAEGNYVYEFDGKYIGQNIGYIFSDNGNDATDADYMIVSQKGNNLTISSIPPAKFTFVLDTNTLTTYWGTTAYLYVWTDAPKVEPLGAWPGKLMTYDSAAKSFTCDIPAEYINKKLNFIVHNNNNWQCADKVMNPVKAEQTYKGNADLGLN